MIAPCPPFTRTNEVHMNKIILKRFWDKVNKNAPNGCWEFIGCTWKGYGRFRGFSGEPDKAHRFSWEIHNGKIPYHDSHNGMCVCHHCDNPKCVNPDHLFLATNYGNAMDMVAKNRQAKGTDVGNAVLNPQKVRDIRMWLKTGCQQKDIATAYNVSKSAIRSVYIGRTWSHVV